MGRLIKKVFVLAIIAGVIAAVARKLGFIGGRDEFEEESDYTWGSAPGSTGSSADGNDDARNE